MLETGPSELRGFARAEAGGTPSFASPVSGFEADVNARADHDSGAARTKMSNVLVHDVRIRKEGITWRSVARLRVTIETYVNGDVLSHLVACPALVGHGRTEHEAIADMIDEIVHDLAFYREADDSTLTSDAREAKRRLAELFQEDGDG